MQYILLVTSVLLASIRSLCSKKMGIQSKSYAYFLYFNGIISLAALGALMLSTNGHIAISWYSVFLAVVYGMLSLLSQLFYMLSMREGALSVCTFFYSSGFVIPAILGAVVWNESVSVWQIIGIIIMIISFVIILYTRGDMKKKKRSWIGYAICAMISSGLVGFVQKVHQRSAYKGELNTFLIVAFCVATALSFILCFLKKEKEEKPADYAKVLYVFGIIGGICIGVANKINTFLSGTMPSMIFYPAVNGGVIIITGLLSCICFKEKSRWPGLILGIFSILLISYT